MKASTGPVLLALAVLLAALPVRAEMGVDTALVLAVDASGSIDDAEFRLQKDGIAAAVVNERVLSAVASGPLGRIALAYVEWGTPGAAAAVVGWQIVDGEKAARAFAEAVLAAPRSVQSYNAIGDAITLGMALLGDCPCRPSRAVIDISGDNIDNRSLTPAPIARQMAAAQGITVNALAILDGDPRDTSAKPYLVDVYERTVIAGPGAFVVAARDRADFARAILQKMALEIAGLPLSEAAAR